MRFVIYSAHTKPSKIKGELPDIVYQYVANDSMIPCHYTFTRDIQNAEFFSESEQGVAEEIARMLNMKVKRLEV